MLRPDANVTMNSEPVSSKEKHIQVSAREQTSAVADHDLLSLTSLATIKRPPTAFAHFKLM